MRKKLSETRPSYFMRPSQSFIWISLLFICYATAECEPGLQCWIQSLSIPLTNTTFTQNQATLTLDSLTCDNITVPSLSSSIPSLLNFQISTSNIGMDCTGTWQLTSANGTGSGAVGVVVTGANISITISLVGNGTFSNLENSTCDVQIPVISLEFYNQSESNLLNKFMGEVQSNITAQIQAHTSTQILNATSTELDHVFTNANAWVANVIEGAVYNASAFSTGGPPGFPTDLPPVPGGLLDLQHNAVVGLMNYVLNDVVGANGTIGLNKIINFITNNSASASFNYANASFLNTYSYLSSFSYDLVFGQLTITPLWLNVTGLDTFAETSFAVPTTNQTLDTHTLMGSINLAVEFESNLTFSDPTTQGGGIAQRSVFRVNLKSAEMFAELDVIISKMLIQSLVPNQLLSPGCIAQTLQFAQINDLQIAFSMEDISVTPAPSADVTPSGDLVNNAMVAFIQSYSPGMASVMTDFLWNQNAISLPTVNVYWPSIVNLTKTIFPCAPKFDGSTINKVATIYACVAAVGCFFLVVLVAYLIVRLYEGGGHAKNGTKGLNGYHHPKPLTHILAREDDPLLGETNRMHALMLNPGVPALIRYGVVLVLFLNVAMFIASNSSLGASVYLVVHTGETATQFPSLFNFSLINSVRDMWNAKVYALSILIALFSGVWPYTKLVLLLLCWCVPARILNLQRRGRILIMLDAMGKWSLIDSFVLILMMVAFHFSLAPPITPNTPEGSIVFKAYVEPHFGFYSFLVATMLSLVVTHFVIKIHDFTLETAGNEDHENEKKEALWAHATAGSPYRSAYLLTVVTVLLCISAVLIGFGISIKSFDFTFRGAFGLLLQFLDQQETLTFSVISLGQAFPNSSITPDSFGTRFIQVSFFIFAVAMPCAYVVCLLVLWMVPLTYKFQSRLLTLTATIHAWSALEVFVISIIAALLELQQFAQFIIGHRCDLINKVLRQYADDMLHGDDKCFDVVATLKTGCWVLFAACVIYVVVGSLVVRGCHNALKGRLERPATVN